MQKGFAHLGLLLIGIIIILGGGYLYLNQSSGIKNVTTPIVTIISSVHTYSNNSLGFEFQYSKDLKVLEDSEEEFNQRVAGGTVKAVADLRKNFKGYVFYEPGKFLGAAVVLEKEENYDASPFTVWVFDNPDNLSIGSWDKKYWYYPFVWGDFTQRRNELAITYLKKAKCRFDNNRQIHNALMILGEVYERQGINKRGCRETYIEAMLLMPQSNAPFELYASGVMRREYDCIGLNYDKRKQVVGGMRVILKKINTGLIRVIDKKLVEYITGLGKEFREYYPHLPFAAFGAKTG